MKLINLLREIVSQRDSTQPSGKNKGYIFAVYRGRIFLPQYTTSLATIDRFSRRSMEQVVTAICTKIATKFFSSTSNFLRDVVIYEYPEYSTFIIRGGYGLANDPTKLARVAWSVVITRDFSNVHELYNEFFTLSTYGRYLPYTADRLKDLDDDFYYDVNRELLLNLDNVVPIDRFYSGKD